MAVVSLFSKSSFRRIGTTEWLAYAFDDHYPSRLPAIDQDTHAAPGFSFSEADKLAAQLESACSTRSVGMMTLVVADKFRGHSDADLEKMVTLLGPSYSSGETRVRIKFGCTCACCISGAACPSQSTTDQYCVAIVARVDYRVLLCSHSEHRLG